MEITLERYIDSKRWLLYSDIIDSGYLEKLVLMTVGASKYSGFFEEVEISITFTDNKGISKINKEFRNKTGPTDIISMQVENFSNFTRKQYVYMGDLILSIDKIEEDVEQNGKTIINHCTHLLIHGILHLMGYNHIDGGDREVMESQEISILKKLNISSPY